MKAVIQQADHTVKVEDRPVPTIKSNQILLKVKSVGLNPTDWKHVKSIAKPGDRSGCDFVGQVVEIGEDVPKDQVKPAELRWGFMRGGINPDRGAFSEYVAVDWDITGVVPSNVTPQEAASIPIPFVTAVQCLYLRLKLPEYPAKANGEWILIWSGSTSVGQFAIQLAKLSGLKVATTASPARWELLKSLGADLIVDYKDPEVVQKLKSGTSDSIIYGIDTISEGGSLQLAQQAFSTSSGGHLIAILFDLSNLPRTDVKTEATIAYSSLGEDQVWGPYTFKSQPEDREIFVKWAKLSTEIFAKGLVKPMIVNVVGNLEDTQEALETLQSGKHNTKLVLNV